MSPLLSAAVTITLVLYALAMLLALGRVLRGPRAQDRVLALDFLFIVGLLLLLTLAIRYDSSMGFEAALLIALFGFAGSSAMARFLWRGEVVE
ncbi:K+/H+ antiporter subunit F [Ramlibacter algicola]|uniref:K+/H+ antiporter subunit F n=1 Tax=Ramlibacter algicola TaxID=2795217 RepID=A0A934Q580_9BURK|nr:K+/H+ antiporter subunit F [Ramlibacter algicola]MBK0394697.1 K+/H+ antiporter subunit F [Ramlibacter algicola]